MKLGLMWDVRKTLGAVVAVFAVLCSMSGAQAAFDAQPAEPLGDFIRDWLLCGPIPVEPPDAALVDREHVPGFYTDHLAGAGGEAAARPQEGQGVSIAGGTVAWKAYQSPEDAIDLDAAVSSDEPCMAYAYTAVEAAAPLACMLAVGSNDGCRVWLNGEEVIDVAGGRGLRMDGTLVPVVLNQGRNDLLLKIDEHGNRWEFSCRLLPLDDAAARDRLPVFEVANTADGTAVLRCMAPKSARSIIKEASMEVTAPEQPDTVLWRSTWAGRRSEPIGIDPSCYGEYRLHLATTFTGGAKQVMDIPFSVGERVEYTLFEQGATNYVIGLGPNASDAERWAAGELQHWLKEVSGAEFPIRETLEGLPETAIIVGFNDRLRALAGQGAEEPAPGNETFTYKNAGPSILIWGGRERGTLYGVMSFLERELGCRWYTPSVSVAPKKERFAFDYLRHSESPGIRVRNDFYYEAFEPIWAARNRVNGAMTHREQPGGVEGYWSVHTFYRFMPPSEFFEEHPEYYSFIQAKGERMHDHAQLCLTNPDVLRIVTERVRKVMRENPQYLIYSVSQNDWRRPCECDACRALVEREGSESGPLIAFVNQVAEAVEDEFPDKFIGTLAYQYTRKPCKTLRPRDNVVIRLCSIECCFSHDFHHCPENKSFVEDIEGWSAIAPHLYIWGLRGQLQPLCHAVPELPRASAESEDFPRQQRHRHHGTGRVSKPRRRVCRVARLRDCETPVGPGVQRAGGD